MSKIACSPLSCLAINLVIIGMILTPLYGKINRIEQQLDVVYKIMINAPQLHEVQTAQAYPLLSRLSLARAQATP